jgi:tetratricopeptide (TPR) repeat protein
MPWRRRNLAPGHAFGRRWAVQLNPRSADVPWESCFRLRGMGVTSNRARIMVGWVIGLGLGLAASAGAEGGLDPAQITVEDGYALAEAEAQGFQSTGTEGLQDPLPVAVEELPTGIISPVRDADSGPLTPEQEGFRSEVERAWFQTEDGITGRAAKVRVMALALGIDNLDSAARALIAPSDPGSALADAMLAVRLAPDLPMAHMALARVMWTEGDRLDALGQAYSGVEAIFRNYEAMTWLVGSLLVMIAAVFIAAPLLFIVSVGVSVFGRASHDLGDLFVAQMPNVARAAVLGTLLLVPLALGEGIMGLVMALFTLGFIYGSSRYRMALGLAVAFCMMGMYPVARTAGTVLVALDSDPVAAATLAVVQGEETRADIDLLEGASETEFLARHVLAVRARRLGRLDEALERYTALLETNPRNPEVLTNLANLRFASGDSEGAVDLYERSAGILDSAKLMFNLSQANARLFHIEEFESALRTAQAVDADLVADLSKVGDADFVADLGFPLSILRSRLLAAAGKQVTPKLAVDYLMPGRLGQDWKYLAGGFSLLAIIGVLISSRFDQASSCTRCGRRICGRCDGTVWNSETCDGCHHLFHRQETTDPVLRMKRLYELQARDTRLGRLAFVVSFLVPGAGGLLARRPDLGFLGIVTCGFAVVFLAWNKGVVPDPLAVGSAGTIAFVTAGCIALLGYLLIVGTGLMIRRNF